jgi:hypothetical protein
MAISKIESSSIATGAVNSSALANSSITSDLVANGAIGSVHVANGAIGVAHHDVSANGTGAIPVPFGTTAQRPAGANGYFRYNTTTSSFEGYSTGAWGAIGGGSSGPSAFITGSNNSLITANNTITQNVFVANNTGALAIGPLIIANGAFLTMNANSRLVIL